MGRKKLTTEDIKERIFKLVGDEYELLSEYVNAKTKFKIKHNVCGFEYEVNWDKFQQGKRCPKCAGTMRLTNEDIVQKIYELVGNEYTKLDNVYVNNLTKFKIKHNLCGHEYKVNWASFQSGSRCPKCAGCYRYTDNEIDKLVADMTNGEYTKLSEYKDSRTKIKIKHVACGHEYEVSWNSFQQGSRCPKCGILVVKDKLAFTNEDIVRDMYELVGNEYTKLDDTYINANTKFKIRHNTCGHEYEVCWSAFRAGSRCTKCAGLYRYTDSEISELISEMTDGEYTKLSEYKNSYTKFKIRHNKCGCEYEVRWGAFQSGCRCPKCAGLMRLTNEEVVKRIHELVGDEYTKLDNGYSGANTKFKIRHNTCGHEYSVSWHKFLQGRRCPRCNQSKGEKFIEDYLTNQGVSFATQVRFDDCRHKLPLPFDFGILNSDGEVVALLEFDGEQHFIPVEYWGGEEALQQNQLRDSIKNEYCAKNKIPLLRIRFDDEDIEERLSLFLYGLKAEKEV